MYQKRFGIIFKYLLPRVYVTSSNYGSKRNTFLHSLGPVVQNFVSVTLSLSPLLSYQLLKANTLLFLMKKCDNPLQCKGFSHFFSAKSNRVFVIFMFEILMNC